MSLGAEVRRRSARLASGAGHTLCDTEDKPCDVLAAVHLGGNGKRRKAYDAPADTGLANKHKSHTFNNLELDTLLDVHSSNEAKAQGNAGVTAPKPTAVQVKKMKGGPASHKSGATRARECVLTQRHAYTCIAGVDEAGRGPLAGPVVAAACILPCMEEDEVNAELLSLLDDSKRLSEPQREAAYAALTAHSGVRWAVAVIGHEEIDRIDILQATFVAMRAAVQHLAAGHMGLVEHLHGGTATATVHGQDAAATTTVDGTTAAAIMTTETNTATASAGGSMLPCKQMDGVAVPMGQLQYCLIDGNMVPPNLAAPAEAIIDGDALCACISAASIIAKVTRDRLMHAYDAQYPQYGFAQHKGYGTAKHRAAIHAHGPCAIHRRSFEPVRGITGWVREPRPDAPPKGKKTVVNKRAPSGKPGKKGGKRGRSTTTHGVDASGEDDLEERDAPGAANAAEAPIAETAADATRAATTGTGGRINAEQAATRGEPATGGGAATAATAAAGAELDAHAGKSKQASAATRKRRKH